MPEDLKLSQIGSSQLPPPFRGHHQIIFACYFQKSSILMGALPQIPKSAPLQIPKGAPLQIPKGCTTPNSQGCRLSVNQYHEISNFCFAYNINMPSFNTVHFDANYSFSCSQWERERERERKCKIQTVPVSILNPRQLRQGPARFFASDSHPQLNLPLLHTHTHTFNTVHFDANYSFSCSQWERERERENAKYRQSQFLF